MGKIICVNGDSFTEESYLEPQYRWSNAIGVTHNLAMGGGSNDRIFYTTIDYLNHNNPDILMIGWTETSRAMLSNLNGSRMIVTAGRAFAEETGHDYPEFIKFYYANCFNEFVNFKNTLIYMIHLQEYCKIKNIKLFYYRSVLCDINEKILTYCFQSPYE